VPERIIPAVMEDREKEFLATYGDNGQTGRSLVRPTVWPLVTKRYCELASAHLVEGLPKVIVCGIWVAVV